MEIAVIGGIVVIAIVAIIGLIIFLYRRQKKSFVAKTEVVPAQQGKPTLRVMTDDEISAWEAMDIATNDIRILEAAYGNIIMPSDINHRTNRLNEILKQQGFDFSLEPADFVGCLADELSLHRQKKQSSLPMIALFRYANCVVHRKYHLGMNQDLNAEQLEELNAFIEALGEQAKAKKEGIVPGVLSINPEEVHNPSKPKTKPMLAKSVEELAEMEARFHTNKLIAQAGKELSAEERQKIFAEQWKIALDKCREKYG